MTLVSNKAGVTKDYYVTGINSFVKKFGASYALSSITEKNIRDWLSSMKISKVTLHNYLRVIKYVLKNAVKDKLIPDNNGLDIMIRFPESKREFLTIEEIQKVAMVDFEKPAVQDAFLFSCFTGLRLADIMALEWSNVKDGFLYHTQLKTGHSERMKLSPTAQAILDKQDKISEKVFLIPTRKHFFTAVRRLMEQADLGKRVTFHCARHTFATLLISNNVEVLTAQKLLGHRDIRSTLIYAKLVDKVKDEAIDKLPSIDINQRI